MSENTKKIIGLTYKKTVEREELLGRALKIEDIVYGFNAIEGQIQ